MDKVKKILHKSNLILKIIFGLSLFVICTSNRLCPDHKLCDCTTKYINCTCINRENITVDIARLPFVGKHFTIKNCSHVKIRSHAMSNLTMNTLLLANLRYLKIESYSFNDSEIKDITIRNIINLDIEKHAFSELKNVANLQIVDVIAENFTSGSFADIEVENIEIIFSQIKNIHSNCFILSNMTKAAFKHDQIENFESKGLQLKEAKKFYFLNNTVLNTAVGSFFITDVEEVELVNSKFDIVNASMIYTDNVKVFSFHHCWVMKMESKAFWSINATNHVEFLNNTLLFVGEDSLFPNLGSNNLQQIILEIENNTVFCNCQLDWIFKNPKLYEDILNTSICIDIYFEDTKLSELIPFIDESGICCGFALPGNNTVGPFQTSPSNASNFYNGLLVIIIVAVILLV